MLAGWPVGLHAGKPSQPPFWAMLAAALVGAAMVMAADMMVRTLFAPLEVPAGAVTAVIGAPYFLFILIRAGRIHA